MFGNSFCFLFSKTYFREYKEKTIFLYSWNQKHVSLVEIKESFLKKKRKEKYVITRIWTLLLTYLLNDIDLLN